MSQNETVATASSPEATRPSRFQGNTDIPAASAACEDWGEEEFSNWRALAYSSRNWRAEASDRRAQAGGRLATKRKATSRRRCVAGGAFGWWRHLPVVIADNGDYRVLRWLSAAGHFRVEAYCDTLIPKQPGIRGGSHPTVCVGMLFWLGEGLTDRRIFCAHDCRLGGNCRGRPKNGDSGACLWPSGSRARPALAFGIDVANRLIWRGSIILFWERFFIANTPRNGFSIIWGSNWWRWHPREPPRTCRLPKGCHRRGDRAPLGTQHFSLLKMFSIELPDGVILIQALGMRQG